MAFIVWPGFRRNIMQWSQNPMNQQRCSKWLAITFCLCLAGGTLRAQPIDPNAPPQRIPKTVEKPPPAAPIVQAAKPAYNPEDDKIIIPKLVGIVIVKSRSEIKEEGISGVAGVRIVDIPLLNPVDIQEIANFYLNRGVSKNDIRSLENDIILYCRAHNRPLVDVFEPDQDVTSGVIQLYFLEGKVGKVSVDNPGHHWFSDEFVARQIRLRPMGTVDMQQLTEDLDWVNRNPFRQVNTVFKAGESLGQADVVLKVEDRFPLRV